jgi:hypothetical protein
LTTRRGKRRDAARSYEVHDYKEEHDGAECPANGPADVSEEQSSQSGQCPPPQPPEIPRITGAEKPAGREASEYAAHYS